MKAITLYTKGVPENFKIEELPQPIPEDSDILVEVTYAGINHGDIIRRERGLFPPHPPPYILGFEGVGKIIEVGQSVKDLKIGQRVAFLVESGAYSQIAKVPSSQAFLAPEGVADTTVAASVCVGLTAWHLIRIADLQQSQAVLIHGGAGGVGSTLIQMCKQKYAKVITTVGTNEKLQFAKQLGADHVINYTNDDFSKRVLELTNNEGIDVIFDCVGQAVLDGNLACIKNGGKIIYFGSASGHPLFPGNAILGQSLNIQGFVIFNMFKHPRLWKQGVDGLISVLNENRVTFNVETLKMTDIASAHESIQARQVKGKVVIDMK